MARENQGVQIALIVFVILTVLLSATTVVFVKKSSDAQVTITKSNSDASAATAAKNKAIEELKLFSTYSGLPKPPEDDNKPVEESIKDATEMWKKDMDSLQTLRAQTLPEEQRNYHKLTEALQGVVRAQHAQLEKQDADLREARAVYDRKNAEFAAETKKLTEEKNTAVADYLALREKINKDLIELTISKNQLAETIKDRDKATGELKSQLDGKIADLEKTLAKSQQQLLFKADEVNNLTGNFTVNSQPQGKIIWVNQKENLAYINLGSDDRLHKRVTFTVFDQTTTDVTAVASKQQKIGALETKLQPVSDAKKKGVIEVINITQPHLAECRIITDSPSNPLLPGDLVFTPLWHPGLQEHFALVGFMDIDGDGISDRQKVHDMIRTGGGVIDAETDDKGNLQGEVSYTTRYLVQGDGKGDGASAQGTKKLYDDAKTLGVETIDLAKFLDLIGYKPVAGEDLAATGRPSTAPTPGQPANNFRARSPQQRAAGTAPGAGSL